MGIRKAINDAVKGGAKSIHEIAERTGKTVRGIKINLGGANKESLKNGDWATPAKIAAMPDSDVTKSPDWHR